MVLFIGYQYFAKIAAFLIFYNFAQMFIDDDTRKRLENIIKGIVLEAKEDNCTAARNLLCASFRTSTTVKQDFEGQSHIKREQADFLKPCFLSSSYT